MRLICAFFVSAFLLAHLPSSANTYERLREVNPHWAYQKDINPATLPSFSERSYREWIGIHLSLVEDVLAKRTVSHLSSGQRLNRQIALNHLHSYRLAGNFPVNDRLSYKTPVFIDRYNNFCAVGYLLKATGFEHIARGIQSVSNLAYVMEIKNQELAQWAQEYGFSREELAWIQPGYSPEQIITAIGPGTNGTIETFYEDTDEHKVYFGGTFTEANGTAGINNIACFIRNPDTTYSWLVMGEGLNGTIYSITSYDDRIVAAGSFTASGSTGLDNVAQWNGDHWTPLGCLDGTIKQLAVHEGLLYAAGNFKICPGSETYALAWWDGTSWTGTTEISGKINAMISYDGALHLGGNFTYASVNRKAIKWNSTTGFSAYATDLPYEVTSFGTGWSRLYAGITAEALDDVADVSAFISMLDGDTWKAAIDSSALYGMIHNCSPSKPVGVYAIRQYDDKLQIGGSFCIEPGVGYFASNSFSIDKEGMMYPPHFFQLNDVVKDYAIIDNELIAGGAFSVGTDLRSIGKLFPQLPASVNEPEQEQMTRIYPNPVHNDILYIENNSGLMVYGIYDSKGSLIMQGSLENKQILNIEELAAGTYFLMLYNNKGERISRKMIKL